MLTTPNTVSSLQKNIVTVGTFGASFVTTSMFQFSPLESLGMSLATAAAFYATDSVVNKLKEGNVLNNLLNGQFLRSATSRFGVQFPYSQRMAQQQASATHSTAQGRIVALDRKVAEALLENGVQFAKRQVVVAPRHLTIKFLLVDTSDKSIRSAKRSESTITLKTGLNRVRTYLNGRHFCVELPNPSPRVVFADELKGTGFVVPIGITSDNRLMSVDLADPAMPHIGLPGPTGTGKTQTQRVMAYNLIRQNKPSDVKIVVIGQKYVDWKPFEMFPHFAGFISDPNEIVAAMAYLEQLTYNRSIKDEIVCKPRIVIFADDSAALLRKTEGAISGAFDYITSQGRAPGVHMVFGSQDWTNAGIGSGIVKANVVTRVVFGAASTSKGANSAGRGQTGVHKLEGKGDCLFISPSEETPVAAAMVTDDQLYKHMLQRYGNPTPKPWRPWLDAPVEASTKAAKRPTPKPARQEVEEEAEFVPAFAPEAPAVGDDGYEKLPDRKPGRMGVLYLRSLYKELGTERAVLKAAWGGVVGANGRTPKTQRWLQEALEE